MLTEGVQPQSFLLSQPVIANLMSRVDILAWVFGNLVNPRYNAGYDTFVQIEVLINHLKIIYIDLIIFADD